MMNKKLKALLRTCTAFVCAVAVCSVNPVTYAADSVASLEQQTSDLQDKVNGLNEQLTDLSSEITDLAEKIEDTDASIKKAELDLAAAKLNEDLQYDAMKMRIKYMYEAGNTSMLHMLLSSQSMGEFLNNTEFVRNVTEYDRTMLDELKQIHNDVEAKEEALKEEQAELQAMKEELDSQQTALNAAISSASGELQASETALAQAREALKKQQEAEKAKQEAEKAKQEQITSNQKPASNNNTLTVPSTPAETNDLVLLAAILQCEAGSTDNDALLAVATVIMNRVESPRYPNNIHDVIYQKGQFSPTWNGSLNRVLAKGPASLCYRVAQDALNGSRLASVKGCYQFRAASTGHAGTVVGGNVFF